jgi:organic hydroperoxide reductase OsmC/OhrA
MSTEAKIFKVESVGQAGVSSLWKNKLTDKACKPIEMAIPLEFEGPGGTYSPEDLYALSLMNCYLATFKYIAEKSKLTYQEIRASAELYVDKGEEKSPWMEHVNINIELNGCENKERALGLMEKTKAHCMIINSVKTKVNFDFLAN